MTARKYAGDASKITTLWRQRLTHNDQSSFPYLQVRLLDGITAKLAARCLHGAEKADWHERTAAWDARADEAARTWGDALPKPGVAVAAAATPVTRYVVAPCTEGSRSTCRRCLKALPPGSIRLGVRSHIPLFNHTVVSWHHPSCLSLRALLEEEASAGRHITSSTDADKMLTSQMEGYAQLALADRAQLCQHMLAGAQAVQGAACRAASRRAARDTPTSMASGARGGAGRGSVRGNARVNASGPPHAAAGVSARTSTNPRPRRPVGP